MVKKPSQYLFPSILNQNIFHNRSGLSCTYLFSSLFLCLQIEVEAVPVGKRDHPYQSSKFQKASNSSDKDLTFGGHKAPTFDTPFEPVMRREVSVYNSITMMKEYESYSFEELRFASLPVTRYVLFFEFLRDGLRSNKME